VPLTRDEALAWQARWRMVTDAVGREARAASPRDRWRSLQRLRASGIGARRAPSEKDEAGVRARFQLLHARWASRGGRTGR
jgi:hypothetical protein